MYNYLEKGKTDISIFSYKKSRESMVMYGGEPVFSAGYRAVVRADSRIKISSLADFDQFRLGHLVGLKYSGDYFQYIQKRE